MRGPARSCAGLRDCVGLWAGWGCVGLGGAVQFGVRLSGIVWGFVGLCELYCAVLCGGWRSVSVRATLTLWLYDLYWLCGLYGVCVLYGLYVQYVLYLVYGPHMLYMLYVLYLLHVLLGL